MTGARLRALLGAVLAAGAAARVAAFCLEPSLHPDEIFQWFVPGEKSLLSVDAAELVIVFGTIAGSLGVMVWFGNWWSR